MVPWNVYNKFRFISLPQRNMKIILLWNYRLGLWEGDCDMRPGVQNVHWGCLWKHSCGKKRGEAGVADWCSPWRIWQPYGSSPSRRVCQSHPPLRCGMWAAWEKTWPRARQVCNWGRSERPTARGWQHSSSRQLRGNKSFLRGESWWWVIATITNTDIFIMPEITFFHNSLHLWRNSGINFKKQGSRQSVGFPGGSDGKESACSAGDLPGFNSWVGKMPWRRECLPTPVFLPGEFQGQRSLVEGHGSDFWRPWQQDSLDPGHSWEAFWEHFMVTMKQWPINNIHTADSASMVAQTVKNQPAIWLQYLGWEDPREKGMATHFQYSGEFHGQRSLVGYSPWGFKVSDTIERLSLHFIADFGECRLC